VQAIDRLHDCLRQLAPRLFPSGDLRDEAGRTRVLLRRIDWDDYVQLAFQEICLAGAGSPQVTRRLEEALLDLREVAPPERRGALDEQLALLQVSVTEAPSTSTTSGSRPYPTGTVSASVRHRPEARG
jgi:uncharacterized membrane protein